MFLVWRITHNSVLGIFMQNYYRYLRLAFVPDIPVIGDDCLSSPNTLSFHPESYPASPQSSLDRKATHRAALLRVVVAFATFL